MGPYIDWLKAQTPERQESSLAHMDLCRRLGEAQRAAPNAPGTIAMQAEVDAYYAREARNDAP